MSDPNLGSAAPGYYPPVESSGANTSGTRSDQLKDQTREVSSAAKDQALVVKDAAAGAASAVAATAKQHASNTLYVAKDEAARLAGEARNQLSDQLATQQSRAAGTIQQFAQGFQDLAAGNPTDGPAKALVEEVGSRLGSIASTLEEKPAAELASDLRSYARAHPTAFLAGAVGIGFLFARFVNGSKAASSTGSISSAGSTKGGGAAADTGTEFSSAGYSAAGISSGYDVPATTGAVFGERDDDLIPDPAVGEVRTREDVYHG